MFLTHCVFVLTVLIQPLWSAVNVIQQYRVDSTNGTARVQCSVQPQPSHHQMQTSSDDTPPYPYPDPQQLRVILLKGFHGNQEICSSILNVTQQTEVDRQTNGHVQCDVQVKEGAVEVMVSGLKPTDTDIYRCKIQVFYPPPFLRFMGNGTLIHILDSSDCSVLNAQRQITHHSDEDEEDERRLPLGLPVVVLMILVILVLIVIIYLQTVQCVQRRTETIRRVTVANMLHKVDTAGFSYQSKV